MMHRAGCFACGLLLAVCGQLQAAEGFENDSIRLRIRPRAPQQIAAFYEARGFPDAMIERLKQVCFFTLSIRNKGDDIIWHDLSRWRFSAGGQAVQRFDRDYWQAQWRSMQAPMASQSTFRWTLLPETLDFRPQEGEGGNITLPRTTAAYEIRARFGTGADGLGEPIEVRLPAVHCAQDTP